MSLGGFSYGDKEFRVAVALPLLPQNIIEAGGGEARFSFGPGILVGRRKGLFTVFEHRNEAVRLAEAYLRESDYRKREGIFSELQREFRMPASAATWDTAPLRMDLFPFPHQNGIPPAALFASAEFVVRVDKRLSLCMDGGVRENRALWTCAVRSDAANGKHATVEIFAVTDEEHPLTIFVRRGGEGGEEVMTLAREFRRFKSEQAIM